MIKPLTKKIQKGLKSLIKAIFGKKYSDETPVNEAGYQTSRKKFGFHVSHSMAKYVVNSFNRKKTVKESLPGLKRVHDFTSERNSSFKTRQTIFEEKSTKTGVSQASILASTLYDLHIHRHKLQNL